MFIKRNKKGFTLLEMISVLTITSVFVIVMRFVLPKHEEIRSVNGYEVDEYTLTGTNELIDNFTPSSSEIINILDIKKNIREYFKKKPSYIELDSTNISSVLPNNVNYRKNSYNGKIFIASSERGPAKTSGSAFSITYNRVPKQECLEILDNTSDKFYQIDVNNKPLSNKNNCFRDFNSITFISI